MHAYRSSGTLFTMRVLLNFAAVLTVSASAVAAPGDWPDFLKDQWIESSCVPTVVGEGHDEAVATNFCTCFASQMEANFSILEYDQMMSATPDPNGDSADRRLYDAAMACRPQ